MFETKTCAYTHHEFSADRASYSTPLGSVCGEHFEAAAGFCREDEQQVSEQDEWLAICAQLQAEQHATQAQVDAAWTTRTGAGVRERAWAI